MNIIALQLNIKWENKRANFDAVRRVMAQAAPEKNSLLVLPEMFATGFSMNDIAESWDGETMEYLLSAAKEYQLCLLAGVAIRGQDNQARNTAVAFSPSGERLISYAKMHPFTIGGETRHYAAGERPAVFSWESWTIAPFVCYDLRFPEIFRLATAAYRPQLFAVIANWPQQRIHHWVRLLQARAIENQAYVVGVNRCGRDPHHVYNGRSLIIDYQGEIVADAGEGEGWITSRLDLAALEQYRTELPFLSDMRTMIAERNDDL